MSPESHKWFEINRLLPPRPREFPLSPSRFDFIVSMYVVERLELATTKFWGENIMKSPWLRVAAVGAVTHLTAVGAYAADLPAAPAYKAPIAVASPAYNWAGWYVGGNIGYGWGTSTDPTESYVDPGVSFGFAAYYAAGGNVTPNLSPRGVVGGGQIGFNWMLSPSWVAGLVTDFQDSGIKASATNFVTPGLGLSPSTQSNSEQMDWFGTLRAKFGYAQNNWLFYGTGGLAYGQIKTSGNFTLISTGGQPPFTGAGSTTRAGWALGAGLNYGLTSNWIVGVEYLYVDLGRASGTEIFPNPPFATATQTISNHAAANIVRVSLDYKF
ncbi:MAG TPA: outer membrane beta-barrel protein [Xanthobacteraceae bacterium]|jgi:outer membrane immunogenic protein|nr:outer membrane beta-barrel protein [Xanthobacteraceae bacterium]